jgi:hypothetical protein
MLARVDIVLSHPPAQARLADPQILGDLRDRLLTSTHEVKRPLTELRWLRPLATFAERISAFGFDESSGF